MKQEGAAPLRVGIAGLSSAATWALREIADLPYIRIVAAADLREDALARFREEFKAQVYTDVQAMCRNPDVDVVLVGTPPHLRPRHTMIAAEGGKHVVVEKPMALSVDEAETMNLAAERNGTRLLCGHTHSFDPAVVKMAGIVRSGQLGKLCMINTWNYNEFIYRPNSAHDLEVSRGLLFNQGTHQVDIVRLIGGGLVRSVRATMGKWLQARPFPSGYVCHMEFEDGAVASMVYGGLGFFDIAEIMWGRGEGGGLRNLETGRNARAAFRNLDADVREGQFEEMKKAVRYGADGLRGGATHARYAGAAVPGVPERRQPIFGLTVVTCERGEIRQSPEGLFVYDEDGTTEVALPPALAQREAEFFELYDAISNRRPLAHDGRWGQATLEVCLAMVQSTEERREVLLSHQVRAVE